MMARMPWRIIREAPKRYNPQARFVPFWILGALLLLVVDLLFSQFPFTKAERILTRRLTEAREVVVACREYARTHEGHWPDSLRELPVTSIRLAGPNYKAISSDDWKGIVAEWGADGSYFYYGYRAAEPANQIVLAIRSRANSGREIRAHADGSAEILKIDPTAPPPAAGQAIDHG